MYQVYRKKGEEQGCVGVRENRERYNGDPVPESVEDDGALVEFVTGVEQLGSNHRGVCEGGGLAANFFAVDQDVAAMSSAVDVQECVEYIRCGILCECTSSVSHVVADYEGIKLNMDPPENKKHTASKNESVCVCVWVGTC